MACEYKISDHLTQVCQPTAAGYKGAFWLANYDDFAQAVDMTSRTVNVPTNKVLYKYADARRAVLSGSSKALADSSFAGPVFTKTLQIGIDKGGELAAAGDIIDKLAAAKIVAILQREDGAGFEVFGAIVPLRASAVDQNLGGDDEAANMITVTLSCNESLFCVAAKDGAGTDVAAALKKAEVA